jgi:predicted nucleotidyltransferase
MIIDNDTLKKILTDYISNVRDILPLKKAILFGSYAKGTAREYNDIDVCFFISNVTVDNWLDINVKVRMILFKYIDVAISPIIYDASEIEKDNPFINEILSTGIEIE